MTQIEDEVLAVRQRLGAQMAQMIVEEQSTREPVEVPCCPDCGEVIPAKGGKRKTTDSGVGTLAIALVCGHNLYTSTLLILQNVIRARSTATNNVSMAPAQLH
jgi:hypothetical protein